VNAVVTPSTCNLAAWWVLAWIGQALLYGTALAGLTWLVTRLFRDRFSAAVHTVLWAIVLVKFLTPVGPSWSPSLASICTGIMRPAPARLPETDSTRAVPVVATPTSTEGTVKAPTGSGVAERPLAWTVPLAAVYIAATLALFTARMRSYRALYVRCRSLPGADAATRELVARVCRRLGVRRISVTRIGNEPLAPFVMGVFRPMLVLSHRHLVRPDELETVIVHEVAHLRRGDVLVQLLQRIAGTLVFFWPVVAWVNRQIDMAREYACDEWTLRHGKLTVGEYARCLLMNAVRSSPARGLSYHPAGMANNPPTIERRIDMILRSPTRSSKRPTWGLPTLAFLLAWSGFALAGAVDTDDAKRKTWPATEQAVKEHAIQLYKLVAKHEAADFDGDGQLSYREKSAYLVALAMQAPQAFMEEFPYADRDHSGRLDYLEAYGTIRGITLIAYADRRPTATVGAGLDLEFYHTALDAQQWLLENMASEPDPAELENIKAVLGRIENPRADHVRKLNHGGPTRSRKDARQKREELPRFKELEANIATIQANLAIEKNPKEVAKLRGMLEKLEAILAKLEADD